LTQEALSILVLYYIHNNFQEDGIIYIGGRDKMFRPSLIINAHQVFFTKKEIVEDFSEALKYILYVLKTQMF
jgi:hypothetical protein